MVETFERGVYLPHFKSQTEHMPIERIKNPEQLIIPLKQHTGASCKPLVAPGDAVLAGQKIGDSDAFVSASVHTALSGVVREIFKRETQTGEVLDCIRISADPEQSGVYWPEADLGGLTVEEMRLRIREAGIVGMGGASFPAHVKLSPPRKIDCFLINGCECEPFLTCDHRIMLERSEELTSGAKQIAKILGEPEIVFCIEINKKDVLELLEKRLAGEKNMRVVALDVKYPQGAEKMLIYASTRRMVPPGKLPYDVGVVVHNVATVIAVYEAIRFRKPLYERVVTFTGPGAVKPGNYLVPIGTPLSHIIESAGGLKEGVSKIILGGPMTGWSQQDLSAPITKGSGGMLALTPDMTAVHEYSSCVRCGKCVDHCPMSLYPNYIGTYAELGRYIDAEYWGAMDCFECGVCTYVCPSYRPIVTFVRKTKQIVAARHRTAIRRAL